MIFPLINSAERPNRLDSVKDEKYHTEMARWTVKACASPALLENMFRYIVNWQFYKGNQWIFREDLEQFLMDDTGDHRNRVRWCYNLIKPMVDHYVGSAIKTDFSVRAYSISPTTIAQRQLELATRLKAHVQAQGMPLLINHYTKKYKLGETPQETEQIFLEEEDDIEIDVNELLRDIESFNRFDNLKREQARSLCLAGLGVLKNGEKNGKQWWWTVNPAYYFYDTAGRMSDHSDCEFQGDIDMFLPTQIYEQYPELRPEQRMRIEQAARNNMLYYNAMFGFNTLVGTMNGRLPKYNCYWHDTEEKQFGFIIDGLGNKRLAEIGGKFYTKNDLVPLADLTEDEKKQVGRSGIVRRPKDVMRYCEFIPAEFVAGPDIVLEYGICPYEETYSDAPFDSNSPYKVVTYDYDMAKMSTPLDVMISPQRMMNRYLSMAESIANKVGGDPLLYDQTLVPSTGPDSEAVFLKDMRAGNPTKVNSARTGFNIQNAAVRLQNNGIEKAEGLQNMVGQFKTMTENATGINQFQNGTNDGTKVLKAVQQNNINQGSLKQEGFFASLADQFYSVYKCAANKGRMIYAANDISLVSAVRTGKAMKFIKFTKNTPLDEMGIRLRRVPLEQTNIDANNDRLLQYLETGLIDAEGFGRLFNRAEMDDIEVEIRRYAKQKAAMGEKSAQDANEAQQNVMQNENKQQAAKHQTDIAKKNIDAGINQVKEQGKDKRETRAGILKLVIESEKLKAKENAKAPGNK